MYITKTRVLIVLILALLIAGTASANATAAQSGAFADTRAEDGSIVSDNFYNGHTVRAHPGGNGPNHPFYTTEEIEHIHNNAAMVTITIQEDDGDTWIYVADENTGDYYRALQ